MKRVLRALVPVALLLAAALPAPAAAAAADVEAPPPFPEPFRDILRGWLDDAVAQERPDRPWVADVEATLENATNALDQGRFVTALGHYEAAITLERTNRFMDAAEGKSETARRSLLLQQADADVAAGKENLARFRKELAAFEDNLTSLKAFESAVFVATLATHRAIVFDHYHIFRAEASRAETVDEAFAYSTFYVTTPSSRVLGLLPELLDAAATYEGLRPPLLQNKTEVFRADYVLNARGVREPLIKPYANLLIDAAENNETAMTWGAFAGLSRANQNSRIGLIYNDAQGRGINATEKMRENFGTALAETKLEPAHEFGLLGLFILAAKDEGASALAQESSLSVLTHTWATQKAAVQMTNDLSFVSPQKPAPKVESEERSPVPAAPAWALLMGLVAIAIAARPARR